MKTTDFISKWEDFRTQKGYMQRLDPSHPLDFFIGINEKGYDELALITVIEPCQMKSSKALEVEKNKRKDGKWATQIASVESKNQEIFARLCVDLVESSYTANSEQEGISRVAARFLAWQRLFATMHETLPMSVLKGLVGELKFAQYLLDKGVSKDDIIQSWQGPSGADRDYVLNDKWYEIKAISTGKDKVTISSLNQLETDIPGCLVVINVDESSKTDPDAVSVKAMVDKMRSALSDAPDASRIFEEKLVSLGYLDKQAYEDILFRIGTSNYYRVGEDFPRLVTDKVPSEIVAVRYDLSLAGIEPWKAGEEYIWS